MKKRFLVGLALCAAAGGALRAQTGSITVKGGAKFNYDVVASMHVSQSIQGQDMTIDSKTVGDVLLVAKKVAPSKIDWNYGLTKAHVRMEGAMFPKPIDSTIKGKSADFSTDLQGRITSIADLRSTMDPMMAMGFQQNTMGQLFSPLLQKTAKPGDSWEEKTADTMDNPAAPGVTMIIKRTTKYTYDGVFDTLKTKAARVRSEVTSMTIEGSGTVQGMEMAIDGDGTSVNANYYQVDNGILVASNGETEMNTRIALTGPMELVIPMTMKMNTSTVRKGK